MKSMTGYAQTTLSIDAFELHCEIKTVNHRYLEVQTRLPDFLRHLEVNIRRQIQDQLQRGKVDCRVEWQRPQNTQNSWQIDDAALQQLIQAANEINKLLPSAKGLSVADILRTPGILLTDSVVSLEWEAPVQTLIAQSIDALQQVRVQEGASLQGHLQTQLSIIENSVAEVKILLPQRIQRYQAKIEERLREVLQEPEWQNRIGAEVALFATKMDVQEELDRLQTHISETRRLVFEQQGPVGKRLDFMMQELNREGNTLASKSIDAEITQHAIQIKLAIESMREQIQNIE